MSTAAVRVSAPRGITLARTRSAIALTLAAGAFFVAAWSFLPPPTYALLALAVAAPEIGVWLVLVAMLAAALALPSLRTRRSAQIAFVLALATIAAASSPLVRFAGVGRAFEQTMRERLGEDCLTGVPDELRPRMQPSSLDASELWFGLDAGNARVTRGIEYAAPEGHALALDVYRPTAAGSYPTIVQIYGGAWQRGEPGDDARFARYFAAHGYVVFAIDYRHAPQWQWPAQLDDTRAALAWIAAHADEYGADVTRLALIGRSSGAQLALTAAYIPDSIPVRAVVSLYGPVDLITGYREPPHPDPLDVRAVEEAYLGGSPDDQPERYARASPISYATRQLPPTLLIYAGRDHVVAPRFGAMLDKRLRATGTVSVLLEIPWAEHAFDAVTGGPSAQLAIHQTERFLAWALCGR
jgi:acetyl esterase/lipase